MHGKAFLAFAFALAAFGSQCLAENLTPFDDTYQLACSTSSNLVGAYQGATIDSSVQEIGNLVYNDWLAQDENNSTCSADEAANTVTNVTAACSQVVAGTNWALLISASSTCQMNATLDLGEVQSNVSLAAKVYEPLGEALPTISMVKLVSMEEDEI